MRGVTSAPVKRKEVEMSNAFSTALIERHHYFTTGSSLSRAMQLASPPILRSLEATDLKMLSVFLQDLPAACICESGLTGVLPDVFLGPIYAGEQIKDALSSMTSLMDLLQAAQSLLRVQVNSIFHSNSQIRECARKQQPMLMQLSQRLWLEAPTSLPDTMTAHMAWKLGESIRRTIIASHLLAAVASASDTAIVHYEPFLASLPFDSRVVLWSMEDDDPWLAYIETKRTPLVSLQEWLDGDENGHVKGTSVLQRILLILYQPWTHRKLDSSAHLYFHESEI